MALPKVLISIIGSKRFNFGMDDIKRLVNFMLFCLAGYALQVFVPQIQTALNDNAFAMMIVIPGITYALRRFLQDNRKYNIVNAPVPDDAGIVKS